MNLNHSIFLPIFCYSIKAASMHSGAESAKEEFVPSHWDAGDTMTDTAWITHWIQGRFGRDSKWRLGSQHGTHQIWQKTT